MRRESYKKKIAAILLVFCMVAGCILTGCSGDTERTPIERVQQYLKTAVPQPYCGPAGGAWAVIGLVQGGAEPEESWTDGYAASVEDTVRSKDGVLNSRTGYKYTEYSRIILGWTAIGRNPQNVAGYNFLEKLTDMDNVCKQGINGPVWALIAFDSRAYEIPANPDHSRPEAKQTTRQALVRYILDAQTSDGGWNLTGDTADADLTAMALTALAPYYTGDSQLSQQVEAETLDDVKTAVDEALACLSAMQMTDGGFGSFGEATSESCAQVVTALSSLGIDAGSDQRFVKDGGNALNALLSYQQEDGGFAHTADGETNLIASEQAAYALAAYMRVTEGQGRLFDMR